MSDRGAVTLADVAARAGVSLATASRALNGSARRVRPEYVERVHSAAQELQYTANASAQAVARGTTTTLALVIGDVADPFFAQVAAGAMREAERHGLVVTMTATNGDRERERAAIALVTGLRPRAVVIAVSNRFVGDGDPWASVLDGERPGGAVERRDVGGLLAGGTGVVGLVSDDGSGDWAPAGAHSLVVGNRAGARSLATALVDAGHRDFAVLGGDPTFVTTRARVRGFVEGLRDRGVAFAADRIVSGAYSRNGGYAAMRTLLDSGARPGCVFAVTDVAAVGALAAVRERGLRPGIDIGIAGFDDVATLQDVVPALTTVRLPLEAIGASAVRAALGEDDPGTISGEAVLRESTATHFG